MKTKQKNTSVIPAPLWIGGMSREEIAKRTGTSVRELGIWVQLQRDAMERELRKEYESKLDDIINQCNNNIRSVRDECQRTIITKADEMDKINQEIDEDRRKDFREKFSKAENLACLEQFVSAIVCLHITYGYTDALRKFVKNWNAAVEHVRRTGLKEIIEDYNNKYKLDIAFDEADILDYLHNEIFKEE